MTNPLMPNPLAQYMIVTATVDYYWDVPYLSEPTFTDPQFIVLKYRDWLNRADVSSITLLERMNSKEDWTRVPMSGRPSSLDANTISYIVSYAENLDSPSTSDCQVFAHFDLATDAYYALLENNSNLAKLELVELRSVNDPNQEFGIRRRTVLLWETDKP